VSSHLGITKTLGRFRERFCWPDMMSEACDFVRGCQECQRVKPAKDSRVGLRSSKVVEKSLQCVFIDSFGPGVKSRRGNIAVLLILDGFSKYVSMYPVRRISSEAVNNCLLEKFFPSFGVPQNIVSVNAALFKSRTFYNLCFSWGIRQITTSPYYP
jgi:hypothetical protein